MRSNDYLIFLVQEIQNETKRRIIDEFIPRIRKCLNLIEEDKVWYRPNKESNSIGNLILHLEGNARQWIISGLGGDKDVRNRGYEFATKGSIAKIDLLKSLDRLEEDIKSMLHKIDIDNLIRVRKVQVFEETGISILIHAIEHFSYHTGQIAYVTKMLTNLQLGFYADLNL